MEPSKLQVLEVHSFPKSCFIKVRILEGSYHFCEYATIGSGIQRKVIIIGRPFIVTRNAYVATDVFALDIQLPDYPLDELVGRVLVPASS